MTRPPFFILSLPRSRSYWLSQFLSYQGAKVGHDLSTLCGSVAELKARITAVAGTCETGAVLGWKVLLEEFPGARMVVIQRSPFDVWNSLAALGLETDLQDLIHKWQLLRDCGKQTRAFSFSDLKSESACREIFEYCLQLEFDREWWLELRDRNLQVDLPSRIQQLITNSVKIAALKAEIAPRMAS